jgi:two-component system nitrogen regulation sensor histidine kinase NtrY
LFDFPRDGGYATLTMQARRSALLLFLLVCCSSALVATSPTSSSAAAFLLVCVAALASLKIQRGAVAKAAAAVAAVWALMGVARVWMVGRGPAEMEDRVAAALELGRADVERSVQELLWLGEDLAADPRVRASVAPEAGEQRLAAFEVLHARLPWVPDHRIGAEVLDAEGRAVAWAGRVTPTPLGLQQEVSHDGAVVGLVDGETYTVVKTLVPTGDGGAVVTEMALQVGYPFESRFLPEGGLLGGVKERTGIPLRIASADAAPAGPHLPVQDTAGGVLALVVAERPSTVELTLRDDTRLRQLLAVAALVACGTAVLAAARTGVRTPGAMMLLWGTRLALWNTGPHLPFISDLWGTSGSGPAHRGWGLGTVGDDLLTAACIAATVYAVGRALQPSRRAVSAVASVVLPAGVLELVIRATSRLRLEWGGPFPALPGPPWRDLVAVHSAVLLLSLGGVLAGWIAWSMAAPFRNYRSIVWTAASLLIAVLVQIGIGCVPLATAAAAVAVVGAPLAIRRGVWSRILVLAFLTVTVAWGSVLESGARLSLGSAGAPAPPSGEAGDRSGDLAALAAREMVSDSGFVAAAEAATGPLSYPLAYRIWAASSVARTGTPSGVWLFGRDDTPLSSFSIGLRLPPAHMAAALLDTVLSAHKGEQMDRLRVAVARSGAARAVVFVPEGRLSPGDLPEPLRPPGRGRSGRLRGSLPDRPPDALLRTGAARRLRSVPEVGDFADVAVILATYAMYLLLPVGIVLTLRRARGEPRYGFRRRLTLLFLAVSLVPVALLTLASLQHLLRQMERSFRNETVLLLGTARSALVGRVETQAGAARELPWEAALSSVADLVGEEVSLFQGGELEASSHAGLYQAELLPTRMSGLAFRRVELEGRGTYVAREWLGNYPYVVGYAPVTTSEGSFSGTLCLPRIRRQEEINARLADAVRVAVTGASIVAVAVIVLGSVVAGAIARPLRQLQEATSTVASAGTTVSVPVPSPEDEIALLVRSFNRMSEEVAASRMALEEKRTFMEAVVSHLGAGVMVVEPGGVVSLINPSAASLLRFEGDVTGERAVEHLQAGWLDRLRDQITSGESGQGRLDPPGSARILQFSVTRLPAPSGALVVLEDVTEIVQWHKNVAWAQMARHVAHEVKNPLTPIKLSAQHLQQVASEEDGLLATVARRTAGTIATQAERLERIAREFSTLARAGAVQLEETDLNALVEESVGLYEATHLRGISLRANLASDTIVCLADPEALRRVLSNLIDNALGATPRGGSISVSTVRSGFHGAGLIVQDTGSGIADEHLQHVFEPGFTTKADGTGLGLAVVREMVDRMGGSVRLDSTEGSGTTVTVELRLAQSSDQGQSTA